jgi:D-glycero-alpha-D-manno-heptose 1-phosphate guanylyltransferase
MAMVAGRPFITHILDQLAGSGIRKVILCTGYMADVIRNELGDVYRGMSLAYSSEDTPLGTGGALQNAASFFSGNRFLVLNGDSYCQCSIQKFIAGHDASGACAGMVLARVEDVARFGAVKTNDASLVESFMEKGGQTGPGWINAGIYVMPMELLQDITPNRPVSLERELFPALVIKSLYGYKCPGPFIDIGIPEEFERAQLFFPKA